MENKYIEHRSVCKDIMTLFYNLVGTHQLWELWEDSMIMFATSISNSVDLRFKKEREERYLSIAKKYTSKELNVFISIFSETIKILESNPEQDLLGELYMKFELGSHWHGQFFTPYHICEMVAKTQIKRLPETKRLKPISIVDPACGGGALILAGFHSYRELFEQSGLNAQDYVCCYAQDISMISGLMCYIQLALQGIAAKVKISNSLTDPLQESDNDSNIWYTPMWYSQVWTMRRALERMKGTPE